MRALALDFQPRRFSAAGLALLAAGLLACMAAIADYQGVAEETGSWRQELARLQAPARTSTLPRLGDDREMQAMMQAASGVARDIQRPWEGLFKALEEAANADVALLNLNPDAARGMVRIAGEAKGRDAILAFVDRLGQSAVLKNVFLVEDQRQDQDPEKPYRFLVSAEWSGVTG